MSHAAAASARLALSRERLRLALQGLSAAQGDPTGRRTDAAAVQWLESVMSIPGASVVFDALRRWWARHPLRLASLLAADATKAVVQPLAQRHPLGLVFGALLLGAAIAWSRPWRWLVKPALLAGLLPQLFTRALAPDSGVGALIEECIAGLMPPGEADRGVGAPEQRVSDGATAATDRRYRAPHS